MPAGHISLVDSATAATLSQVLPVLLLTLAVEMRRHELHLAFPRFGLGAFFLTFGLAETVLVLSIDGTIYPFQPFDGFSALTIFAVMTILFKLSLSEPAGREEL